MLAPGSLVWRWTARGPVWGVPGLSVDSQGPGLGGWGGVLPATSSSPPLTAAGATRAAAPSLHPHPLTRTGSLRGPPGRGRTHKYY